jgi:hypothetical protein
MGIPASTFEKISKCFLRFSDFSASYRVREDFGLAGLTDLTGGTRIANVGVRHCLDQSG